MGVELAEKIGEKGGESIEPGRLDELRGSLERCEKTGIGFPFDFSVVEALDKFQDESEIKKLIREKQGALKLMIEAIENEKEMGFYKNGQREQKVYNILKILTGDQNKS